MMYWFGVYRLTAVFESDKNVSLLQVVWQMFFFFFFFSIFFPQALTSHATDLVQTRITTAVES